MSTKIGYISSNKKYQKNLKIAVDKCTLPCYHIQAFNETHLYARVVELVDSLDSGSSAHSGHAGSSPASRTKKTDTQTGIRFFIIN